VRNAKIIGSIQEVVIVCRYPVALQRFQINLRCSQAEVHPALDISRYNDYPYYRNTGGPLMAEKESASAKRTWRSSTREPLERQVYLLLQHVSGELVHELSTLLKPDGITPEQYQVLRILHEAGTTGIPLSLIAERSPAGDPDVTRLIDRLEKRGLAQRERDSEDRRVITATITADGRRLFRKLEKPVAALHDRQLETLGRRGLADLRKLLQKVAEVGPVI
jgi:DNA-binding MarR family transcriptional regulator